MMSMVRRSARHGRVIALALALSLGAAAGVGHAVTPGGACCLPNGQCVSELEFVCDQQGGDFIGANTSCVMIECPPAPVSAPLLSLFGVIAAAGALGGLGVYRLMVRRRA